MGGVLVVFGSKSDSFVYSEIVQWLACDFRIASAHRTPDYIDKILEKDYDLIIAGAGLAAHLPGVIASKTTAPVIGVPVSGSFEGLDALFSIVQMPPGIPVLGVCVDGGKEAVRNAKLIRKDWNAVNFVSNAEISEDRLKKMFDLLDNFGIEHKTSDCIDPGCINVNAVELGKTTDQHNALVINVPIKIQTTAIDSKLFHDMIGPGLWVGMNRLDNAAVAAAEIMKKDMTEFREKMRLKVLENAQD